MVKTKMSSTGNNRSGTKNERALFSVSPRGTNSEENQGSKWKIIIADDERTIHEITRIILLDFEFEGVSLELLSAYSAQETKQLLCENPDTAVILLDVIMESDDAGLEVTKYIRENLKNNLIQIILRTGQPGSIPATSVMTRYEINGYKAKTELTTQKLFTSITSSLRAYKLSRSYFIMNKHLKKEIKERKKAELNALNAIKTKSAFLANLSHELRTPMNGIIGFSELGTNQVKLGLFSEDEILDFLKNIHKSGNRLMKLINGLVDLSRLASGKMNYDMELEDLNTITLDTLVEFKSELIDKELTLSREFANPISKIHCDALRLSQVIGNLLSNAIKFSHPGTTILLKTKDLKNEVTGTRQIKFTLINKGILIPPKELRLIFSKFTQSSNIENEYGGTGLGLAICEEIVLAHNGQIWAENVEDEMTAFHFTIPVYEQNNS